MFIPSYLARSRHGVFYFRWPLASLPHTRGRASTLKVSLGTRDPKQALPLALNLSNVGRTLTAYGLACGMTFEEVRRLLTTHFAELLAKRKMRIAKEGRLTNLETSVLENSAGLAQDAIQTGEPLPLGQSEQELAARFMEKYEISIPPSSPAHKQLGTEVKIAYRDYCSSVLAYDRSMESYDFSSQLPPPVVRDITKDAPRITIQALFDRYTTDGDLGGQWVAKTRHEKSDHISLLAEILGDATDITGLTSISAQKVKDTLIRYPRNRRKNPATRELTLDAALEVKGGQTINVQTINKYLQTYGTMFGWAERNGFVTKNVFGGLSVRISKKQSKSVRTAFGDKEIQAILQELLHNKSGLVRASYQKWGPLIALYSGARLNEIAQIHLSDIRKVDDIWCFDLNDDDETKKLKTDTSRRCVPIHSQLIELGLLDHIEALRSSEAQKLFQGFTYCSKNGWGRSLGRWFNDTLLVKLELKKQGVSFHVFRHTVVTRLFQAGVEEPMIQTIVGHERAGVTHKHYFNAGYKMSQRQEALEKLRFDMPHTA